MLQALPSLPSVLAGVPFRAGAVVVIVVGTLLALRRLTGRSLLAPLRARLLFGVPWGTLLTMAVVLAIYLFVQGAWWHSRPLVTPFRTWSYFYPLGIIAGAFTHGGQGHVTGNLLGTLVYGTVVEYAWSHYPRTKGVQTFTSLRTNPYARILAIPAGAFAVGLFTALFALGPVIGFSGVVFALAGFGLVMRPTLTLGALFARRIVDLVYRAVRFPEFTTRAESQFITPWWAEIAIQGHAVGLLAGVFLAVALLKIRRRQPRLPRVFFAGLIFSIFQGLWAIYIPLGGGRFTLFRWVGTALVFLLALVITAVVSDPDRPLVPNFDRRPSSIATFVLVVVLGALCLSAVPTSVATISEDELPEDGIEIRDYVVTYDENIQNEYAASIWLPFETDRTQINESGIVIASNQRDTWLTVVQKGQLALNGRSSVIVGGVGWRETVYANRTSWVVLGNKTVYRVQLRRTGGDWQPAYNSPASTADATIQGRNITVEPTDEGFSLEVRRNNTSLGTGPVPANMTSASIGGLTFERNRSKLYVGDGQTRVKIAERREDQRMRE